MTAPDLRPDATPPQARPLDLIDGPLAGVQLIEASAGTGKTWAICGLVLRLVVEQGLSVDQVLVVTFTKAATAELRTRIRARLAEALATVPRLIHGEPVDDKFLGPWLIGLIESGRIEPATLLLRLHAALQCFDEAAIHTIHGYCQRALAEAAFSARLPLEQTLSTDDHALHLQLAADFWRHAVAQAALPPGLAGHLLARGDSPERWATLVRRQLALPLAHSRWPEALDLDEATLGADAARSAQTAGAAQQDLQTPHARLQTLHRTAHALWLRDGRDLLQALQDVAPTLLNARSVNAERLQAAANAWDAWFAADDPLAPLGERMPLLTADALRAALKGAAAKAVGAGESPPAPLDHAFLTASAALLHAQAEDTARLERERLRLLRRLLDAAPQAMAALKRERRLLAFDDLLGQLHQRLHDDEGGPALLRRLRQRYPAALIDEFQDTDPLQWAIFWRLYGPEGDRLAAEGRMSGAEAPAPHAHEGADDDVHGGPAAAPAVDGLAPERPLFLVGDPKQAIYSFRGADLPTYLRARGQAAAVWTLADNQRSVGPLITAMNTLWRRHDRPFMQDGLHYQPVGLGEKPRTPLIDRSPQADPAATAALQLWTWPAGTDGDPWPLRAQVLPLLLQATAGEIARLLRAARTPLDPATPGGPTQLMLGTRALAAGDIAVLVRSHRQAAQVRQALAALGIGAVELSAASIWSSPDAADVERLLAAVLEPTREPLLRAALATPLLGADAAQLQAWAEDESGWLAQMQRFADWRTLWLRQGVGVLLRRLLADAALCARLLARPDGERRMTNLLHLAEALHEAADSLPSPEALLRWLQSRRAEPAASGDERTQLRLESDRHLVQIVTIHRSKGLEYPLVFCPFLGLAAAAPPEAPACDGTVWRDPEDPTGRLVVDWRTQVDPKDGRLRRLSQMSTALAADRAAEELRLIYVALTRAVHRCHLPVGGYRVASGRGFSARQAGHGLLNWLAAGSAEIEPATAWLTRDIKAPQQAAIDTAWATLAAAVTAPSPPQVDTPTRDPMDAQVDGQAAIAVRALPFPPALPLDLTDGGRPIAHVALPTPERLPRGWRIGSYSALLRGATHELSARDHDAHAAPGPGPGPGHTAPTPARNTPATPAANPAPPLPTPQPPDPATLPADDPLRYPRGAEAGDSLHQALERADFGDPSGWPQAAAAALDAYPALLGQALRDARAAQAAPPSPSAGPRPPAAPTDPASLRAALHAGLLRVLDHTLHTPLPLAGHARPLRLADLPAPQRRAEFEFHLPVDTLDGGRLNALLARHQVPMPALDARRPLHGYLKGYIDLVFCHEGRWWLLDWKSNHLGLQAADYDRPGLDAAMAREGYHLQHLLYTVALQRWLARRIADWDPQRHFGGVIYLFLRGLRPGWVQHHADPTLPAGQPCGLWQQHTDPRLIAELSALFPSPDRR
jgi:exodeoxyribonuclease V beta subunit